MDTDSLDFQAPKRCDAVISDLASDDPPRGHHLAETRSLPLKANETVFAHIDRTASKYIQYVHYKTTYIM